MDEPGSLRWLRVVQQWELYDVGMDERKLRVFYLGGGGPLADVVVAETGATVAISLFTRELVGTYPDGSEAASNGPGVTACLQVELARPLDGRTVLDGSTGTRCRRADPALIDDNGDDALLLRIPDGACPLWVP